MLVQPVLSNEYEVASQIIKSMLQKGLITKKEHEKIDKRNKQTFISEAVNKCLDIKAL